MMKKNGDKETGEEEKGSKRREGKGMEERESDQGGRKGREGRKERVCVGRVPDPTFHFPSDLILHANFVAMGEKVIMERKVAKKGKRKK